MLSLVQEWWQNPQPCSPDYFSSLLIKPSHRGAGGNCNLLRIGRPPILVPGSEFAEPRLSFPGSDLSGEDVGSNTEMVVRPHLTGGAPARHPGVDLEAVRLVLLDLVSQLRQ